MASSSTRSIVGPAGRRGDSLPQGWSDCTSQAAPSAEDCRRREGGPWWLIWVGWWAVLRSDPGAWAEIVPQCSQKLSSFPVGQLIGAAAMVRLWRTCWVKGSPAGIFFAASGNISHVMVARRHSGIAGSSLGSWTTRGPAAARVTSWTRMRLRGLLRGLIRRGAGHLINMYVGCGLRQTGANSRPGYVALRRRTRARRGTGRR
jgi:hypothetical protein